MIFLEFNHLSCHYKCKSVKTPSTDVALPSTIFGLYFNFNAALDEALLNIVQGLISSEVLRVTTIPSQSLASSTDPTQ